MKHPIIFYADDDCDDRLFFKEASVNIPATVLLFDNGIKLISALCQFTPAMIFLDLNMPVKSGLEILMEIKACEPYKNIPVIILSTASDHYSINKVRNCGANFYIPKANSFVKLQASLEHAVKIDWNSFRPSFDDFLYKH